MRFQVLGPVEAWRDQTQVALGGPKLRTAFAALLLARGRVVTDSRLTALLWEEPPATCAAQIHTYMSRLRHLIGPYAEVVRQRPGYLLRLPSAGAAAGGPGEEPAPRVSVDLLEFERLTAHGRRAAADGDLDAAAESLHAALATWSGPVLGGVTASLAEGERPHLEETRLTVLEERVDADLALGRHAALVTELMALNSTYPLRERLRGQLMTALYRCDRQADALSVYQDGRRVLAEELGIDPGPTLRNLHQSILRGDLPPVAPPRSATSTLTLVPPAAAPAPVAAPLPAAPADFTGRGEHVLRLRNLLAAAGRRGDQPAVGAVVGMAGVGKTALALHVARLLAEEYPDGQIHVDMRGSSARPRTPHEAMTEVLRLLCGDSGGGLPAGGDGFDALYRGVLLDRRALIVLDDVADERQVRPLLPGMAGCGALLTSRSRLSALAGVRPLVLAPFAPGEAYDLLRGIAGAERLAAEPQAADAIVEACGHLPLAVRIAGSRLVARPHWPLARLAERLAEPHRRMDELQVADLALRDALASGYDRLRPSAQRALRLLSLLDSPHFCVWTAALLLDLPLGTAHDLVELLVDAHMVEPVEEGGRGRPMYRLSGLVRSYLAERAGTDGSARERRAALERVNGHAHDRPVWEASA
ncbi:BTAD domain-containing putative transcriptional regulator [Streptomyces olivoreticuli]